jgi:hypothetical protein
MDKKITLIITGQLRLQENQMIKEKINYHIDKLKPHNTILFLWESEYQQHKNNIEQLNLQTITLNDNLPIYSQDAIDDMFLSQNKLKQKSHIDQNDTYFYNNVLKQLYTTQYIFQNLNYHSDIYIKTRYDNIYLNDFKINNLSNFYNENKPIISTPFGGDLDKIGLGDLLTITNNKANNIYKNIYDIYLQQIKNQKIPMYTELALRYIFKNLNHSDIYRFHFLMTTEKYLKRQLIYHADRNIFQTHGFDNIGEIIGKDNLYLPDFSTV